MFTFLKAQTAALIASIVDFIVTVVAVELLGFWYLAGAVTGAISGGITHFLLGRGWVFNVADRKMPTQAFKYFMVWNGSLALNASGVYLFTHYGGINYIFSKIITSLFVGVFYNYVIQKKYVFK